MLADERANERRDPLNILGFDIGGTKTAVILGTLQGEVLARSEIPTLVGQPFEEAFSRMIEAADQLLAATRKEGHGLPQAISVAIGGPLEIERGIIYSPPHLPTWEAVPLKERLEARFKLPVFVEHDGNAGALAEYYFGAGRGKKNLIYLTLGTGLGAGLILNGQVYRGTTDAAGEVGHIRLAEDGPQEYGKAGSWEGLCSGAGLAKLAHLRAPQAFAGNAQTNQVVRGALNGDPDALVIVAEMGRWLGKGIAILVDVLNPEVVVVGTLGVVLGDLLLTPARRELRAEALPRSAEVCQIVPAVLGRSLSSLSALMAAIHAYHQGAPGFFNDQETKIIRETLLEGMEVRRRMIEGLAPAITATARLMIEVLKSGGLVVAFGNGGSASSAQHLSTELIGRYKADRVALRAVALTSDSNVITCIGNDYGYDQIFSRQAGALLRPGDLAVGFTTSGRSRNVLNGLRQAGEMGAHTIAMTGAGGLNEAVAEHVLAVPTFVTARVQEEHDVIIHAWCDLIDRVFAS